MHMEKWQEGKRDGRKEGGREEERNEGKEKRKDVKNCPFGFSNCVRRKAVLLCAWWAQNPDCGS